MHPDLTHLNYVAPSRRDTRAFRKRGKAAGGGIRNWFRAAYRNWQRNGMIAALASLDDATLRGQIPSFVDGLDDHELGMVPVAEADDARR